MRPVAFAIGMIISVITPFAQDAVDPALRTAVERFYATQQAEDVAGYLSLWSATAARPAAEQLKYVFDSGDDQFSGLTILRVSPAAGRTVVRASVIRDRTNTAARRPDGTPVTSRSVLNVALTFVMENGEWKIVREGPAVDLLVDALLAASSAAEREKLISEEPDIPGAMLVSAISRQADALTRQLAYGRAQVLYELALETATRSDLPKLQGEALQNIGNALYYQRKFPEALTAYSKGLEIERTLHNDEGIANALAGIGTVHYSQFEYTDALESYREALAINERLGDVSAIATTLVSTGNVQFVEGDFAGAITDYSRSRALFAQAGDKRGEARALDGLGRTFAAQGDFAGALLAYSGVLDEGRAEGNHAMQGTALSSMGEVHFRMANLDTARGLFEESRSHFEALKDLPSVGRVWHALALTDLVASRFAAAEQEYSRSQAVCNAARDSDCVARAIVGLAFAQAAQEHFDLAIASYRLGVGAFTALKRREDAARAEVGLSRALLGTRDYAAALSAAVHAHDEGVALGRDDVVWRALVAQARALRRMSDGPRALAKATLAAAVVDRMALASLDRPNEALPSDTAGVYAVLAVLQAEAGDARGAFVTVEKGRTLTLRNALATNERDIWRGMTETEREEERRLGAEVVTIRTQVEHAKALPKPEAERIARLQASLAAAVEKRRTSQRQLFARLPDLAVWRGLTAAATLDNAAELLRDGSDVIAQFLIDDEDLLVLLVSRQVEGIECRAYLSPITRQVLAERIAHAIEPAVLRSVDEWRRASLKFLEAIPPGAWAAIAAAPHVLIMPDDVLWRVPFEALPVASGFLSDRTTVAYAGSASSLLHVPAAPAERSDAGAQQSQRLSALIVASPELPKTIRDRVKATSPGWTLPDENTDPTASPAFVHGLTESAVAVLSGSAATESAFRQRAGEVSVIHLAAPFRMNGGSPLFSPVLLTPGPATDTQSFDNDGILETREVMNLELHARLAILADGDSGSSRGAAPATDVVRWAWRSAGVPSVVFSRWPVDSNDSLDTTRELYGRLEAGDAPETALQAARAVARTGEGTRAPYFWAGWMIVGR